MAGDNELLIRAAIADELTAPLQAIKAELATVRAEVEKLDAASAAGGRKGLTQMSTAMGGLSKLAKSTHGSLLELSRGLTDTLFTAAKRGAEGVALLAAGLVVMGVKAAANFESAKVGIETFAGGVAKGDALFSQLRGLQNPFNITQLQDAAQAMLVATDGADHLVPRMKALADIAATQRDPGAALTSLADALNKVQEMGTVDARTIRPLLSGGLPIYEMLASELGVPVTQVKKTLASGAPVDLPIRFFADLEAEAGPLDRFKGAAEKARGTLRGQFSGIKLDVQNQLADLFAPLGDSLKAVTPGLRSAIHDLIAGVGPNLTLFLTSLVALVAGLIPILQPIASSGLAALAQVFTALVPALTALTPQVPALATAFANLFIALIPLIPPLTQLLVALTPVLVLTLERLTAGVTRLVEVVTPLITRFADWVDRSSALRSVLSDLLIGILAYAAIARIVGIVLGLAKAIIAVRDAVVALQAAQGAGGILRVLTGATSATAAAGTAGEIGAVAGETTGLSAAIGGLTPVLAALAPVAMALAGGAIAAKLQSDNAANNAQFGDYGTAAKIDPGGKMRAQVQAGDQADANYWLRTGKSPAARYMEPSPAAKADDSGYISNDPRGYAQAQADLAAQGWRQDPKTGKLVAAGGAGSMDTAGGGDVHVHVAGDVVGETSNIFSRIAGAVNQAMTEQQRNKVERGASK